MKTIVGTWHDTRGNLAAWGKLHLVLNQDAHVKLTAQVAPRSMTFQLDVNGTLMAGSKVWANDELDPPGTYYTATVTAQGGGVIWGPQWIVIAGFDPVDITSITPLRMIPPINQFSTSTTPPVFGAGVINTPVTSELGFDPNAFMTVSDELILAPGNNVLFSGSRSQHSMTVTINAIGGAGPGPGGGAFTAGIAGTNLSGAGTTVSNQLLIAGGSNITISRTTNAAGMTMSIIGLSGGGGGFTAGMAGGSTVTNQLFLAGGNNITLSPVTNAAGMTISINAASQSAQTFPQFTGGIGGTNTTGIGSTVTNQLVIAGGDNITLSRTTNAAGMTVSIIGLSQGTGGGGGSFSAGISGGNMAGTTGIVSDRLVLAGGANVTLSGSTNAGSATVSVSALPYPTLSILQGVGGTTQGASNVTLSSLRLVAGSNILLAQSGNSVTINALATGGEATGGGGAVSFVQGSNISITQNAIAGVGTTATIGAAPAHFSAGISTVSVNATLSTSVFGSLGPVTNQLMLVPSANMSFSGSTNDSGMTVSMSAPRGVLIRQMSASGGSTLGNGGAGWVPSAFRFIAGSNILLSGTTNASSEISMTIAAAGATAGGGLHLVEAGSYITISTTASAGETTASFWVEDPPFLMVNGVRAGFGTTAGTNLAGGLGWFLYAGSNIQLSAGTALGQPAITIDAIGLRGVGISGGGAGSTSGNTQTVNNQLRLVAGSNITLSGATNTAGLTVTVNGASGGAGAAGNFGVISGPGGTTGGTTATVVMNSLRLAAGSNIHLNQDGQTVTIACPDPFYIGAVGAAGGSQVGTGGRVYVQYDLYAGSNITLSQSMDAMGSKGSLTIVGASGGGAGPGDGSLFGARISLGGGVGAATGGTSAGPGGAFLTGGLQLQAGQYVSLWGSTDTNSFLTCGFNVKPFFVYSGSNVVTSTASNSIGQSTTVHARSLSLVEGFNINLATTTNASGTIATINVTNLGTAPGQSLYLGEAIPLLGFNTTINTFITNSIMFWPLAPVLNGSNFTAAVLPLWFNVGSTGTARGTFGVSLGVYTRTGSSLSLAGSTNTSLSYSVAGIMVNFLSYNGVRNIIIPWTHKFDNAKDHWMAIRLTANNSTYQTMSISALCCQAPEIAGTWGQAMGSGYAQPVPGWGIYGSTSMPSSLAMSDLNNSLDHALNTPVFYYAGFSV